MKLYLAGFDVFRADAKEYGERLKQLCAKYGFQGAFPLDHEVPEDLQGPARAQWICRANLALIDDCDAVLANVNPFRGAEPDSGTAFEMGYAHARGKTVWAYTDMAEPLVEQAGAEWDPEHLRHRDIQGYTVEDFGLNLNAMLACTSQVVVGDVQVCLAQMAQTVFGERPAPGPAA